jgi:plasmid segregation protein ParM
MFRNALEYQVSINGKNYLVGDAARQSFTATRTLTQEKPPEIHDTLLLTAAHLLSGDDDRIEIGVGLPLAYYKDQQGVLMKRLTELEADVTIEGKQKHIRFASTHVLPQGAGILDAHKSMLPLNGFVGLVDIGTYTTEYLLFELKGGKAMPVVEASGSVEAGVQNVYAAIAREFQTKTGRPLPVEMESMVAEKALAGETVSYNSTAASKQIQCLITDGKCATLPT